MKYDLIQYNLSFNNSVSLAFLIWQCSLDQKQKNWCKMKEDFHIGEKD